MSRAHSSAITLPVVVDVGDAQMHRDCRVEYIYSGDGLVAIEAVKTGDINLLDLFDQSDLEKLADQISELHGEKVHG